MADQLKPLSDKLDINKIAEIKKKILSNRSNWEKILLKHPNKLEMQANEDQDGWR